jgi:signal transduction histidine kinase/ABC-type amino acid transport substrate-binding protein
MDGWEKRDVRMKYAVLGPLLGLLLVALPTLAQPDGNARYHLAERFTYEPVADLDPAEQGRLHQRPEGLRVGIHIADREPLETTTERNRYLGISADYLALLQARLGTNLDIQGFDSRELALQALQAGQLDLLTSADDSESRLEGIEVHAHYLIDRPVAVIRSAQGEAGLTTPGRILLLSEYGRAEQIRAAYPHSAVARVADLDEALNTVQQGHADMLIGNELVVRSYLAVRPDRPLRILRVPALPDSAWGFATRTDDRHLNTLLQRAVESIAPSRRREIEMRWTSGLGAYLPRGPLHLSEAERMWIARHPRVRVMASHYPPYLLKDAAGQWQGLDHDLLERIAEMTGLVFDYVPACSVGESLQALQDGQADMVSTLSEKRHGQAYERFAVSKRHPLLSSIVEKSLEAMPVEEMRALRLKWLGASPALAILQPRVPDWLWWLGAASVLFGLVSSVWSARLRRQITQKQRLEQQLIEARRVAEQANQAKSVFLTTVSHDLRTPLSAIIGLLELEQLQRQASGAGISTLIETARQSALELIVLAGDTLDIARIEAGRLQLAEEPLALRPLLDQCVELFAGLARHRSVDLHVQLDEAADRSFWIDPLRLRQVLHNLIGNALKFTHQGQVAVRAGRQGKLLRLEVIDTGCGIDERELSRLFEPFTQGLGQTVDTHRGTGLGLSICKRLVELMQGSIRLHSDPGQGTRVVMILPLREVMPVTGEGVPGR